MQIEIRRADKVEEGTAIIAVRSEKSRTYGTSDVIAGLIMLLMVFLVCVL